MRSSLELSVKTDAGPFMALLELLKLGIEQGAVKGPLPTPMPQLARAESMSTDGDLVVTLYPSDAFLRLVDALVRASTEEAA